jgi:hypothetical protein
MPLYEISAPDGKTYQIEGPPDASDADVARAVLAQYPEAGKAPFVAPLEDPGFFRAIGASAKSTAKSLLPAAGLMVDPASQQSAEELQKVSQEAEDAYRRTQFSDIGKLASEGDIGGALGATWSKFKELAGESIGFQAPAAGVGLAAAGAAAMAPVALPAAAIGTAAYGLTLLGQYIASNLGRQLEENKGKPVERLDATVAGVGQSALDLLGGKYLGLSKVLGLEGKKASEMALKELTDAATNPIKYRKEVVKGGAKGIAFELPQEVTQSVLERWQAGLEVDPFKDPGAAKEYAEAAAGALMLGGPLGAVGQVGARRAERAEAIGELQSRAEADALARRNILESEEYKNAPYEERFTGIPPEFGPIPASAQQSIFTEELPPSKAPSPTQAAQDIAIAEQEAAELEDKKQDLLRVRGILDREMQRAPLTAARIGQVAPKDALKTQIAEVDKQLEAINTQLKKASRAAGIKEPTKREARAAVQEELAPSQYFREYGVIPEEPVPAAVEQESLQLTEPNVLALFKPNKKGAPNLSVKSTNLYKNLVGLDLTTDADRRWFKTLIDNTKALVDKAPNKKISTLDFTAAENLYKAALDYSNRAFEQTRTPKTRIAEPVIIGEQPAAPTELRPIELPPGLKQETPGLELKRARERPQQEDETSQIITDDTKRQVGGYPLLAPQMRPRKGQEEKAAPTEPFQPELVTDELADDLGIPTKTKPAQALRQALYGGRDLTNPEDAQQVRDALVKYRDSGAVSKRQKENINTFLRGNGLVEQQGFDFAAADQGAPDVRPETRTGREGMVAPVQSETAEGQGAAGARPADVAGAEGPVDTDIRGKRREQRTLGKKLQSTLENLNIPSATAKELVESYTDNVTGEIDVEGLTRYIEEEFGLNLKTPPVGAKLNSAAAQAVTDGKLKEALQTIAKTGSTPLVRMVAQKLLGKIGGTKIQVADVPESGRYDPNTDTIYVSPAALYEHTVLHEMLHAAISHVIRNRFHPLTQQLAKLYQKIAPRLHGLYGAQDVQEFAAESQSNPEFREALKNIPLPQGALKTAWDHVVNAVRRFLGMAPRESQTSLDKVDRLIDDMLTVAEAEPRTPGDILFLNADVSGAAAAYKDFLNQTGAATRALPGMSPQWVDKVGGLSRSLVNMITKTLDLNHLVEIYGNRVPALRGMVSLLNEKRGFENTQLDLSAQISKELGKARENYIKTAAGRTAYDKFTKVIYDSTTNLYDPSNPDEAKTNKLEYGKTIQNNYNSLPDDLKQLYKKIKDNYTRLFQYYIAGLEKDLMGLDEKERKEIIEGIKSRITPYFPLMRFGDYWLEFEKADQTGEKQRYVHAFESPEARARFIKDAKIDTKSPGFKIFTKLEEVTAGKVPPSEPMIRRTLKALKEQGMDQDSIDRVYRELLKMYPQQSAILNMIRRENVPGYEMDVLRSFNEMTPKLIRQSASRLYNRNVEETAGLARAQLQEISATDPRGYSPLAEAVARELSGGQGSRLETILNPRMSSLASAVNWLTYGYFMGGNVSTALINMTQTAMVAYPILAAEMGPIKAASALMSASKFYGKHAYKNPMENWKKYGYLSPLNTMSKTDPLYKLYEELQRRGQINISISQEILDLQATRGEPASKLKRAVNFAMSAAHQHTEMANREITAIAAYRLAKEKGKSEQDAVNYAVDIVTKSHGSGMLDTAGPIFQHPYGRVVLMFKRFSQLMLFRAARTMYVAISGDSSLSPQEQAAAKALARKQLVGIYAMAFAFSGAQGLPLFGIVEMLYNVLQAAFGDDNEYADFQQEAREAVGDLAFKGPVNALLNLEIAQRTGFGDLLIRDDSRSKAELGALRYYIEQFFGGAPLSMLTGMSRGFSMINDGNIERGLEAMLPVAIRNGFKATRFMTEGARTLKGDPIDEDIGLYNSLFQAAGFAPADLTDIYAKRGYAKELEMFIKTRKSRLLDQYELALDAGDSEALSSVQDKISAYNQAFPEVRITGDTIRKSIDGRRRREQQAIYGVQISPKLRNRIMEEIGYEQ